MNGEEGTKGKKRRERKDCKTLFKWLKFREKVKGKKGHLTNLGAVALRGVLAGVRPKKKRGEKAKGWRLHARTRSGA